MISVPTTQPPLPWGTTESHKPAREQVRIIGKSRTIATTFERPAPKPTTGLAEVLRGSSRPPYRPI